MSDYSAPRSAILPIVTPGSLVKDDSRLVDQESQLAKWPPLTRGDALIALVLGILAASMVIGVAVWHGDALAVRSLGGRWFQSDGWRAFDNMVDPLSSQHRNQVRPLFSLLVLPVTLLLQHGVRLSALQSVWGVNALCIALWTGILFLTIRLLGISRLQAGLMGVLGMVGGAALFWFTVPETYALSSLALVCCLGVAAYEHRHRQLTRQQPNDQPYGLRDVVLVLVGTFCMGTVLTNWMASLVLNAVYRPWRRAIGLSLASLLVLCLGWGLQKVVFPQPASFFLKLDPASEKEYVLHEEQGTMFHTLHTALVAPMIVPAVQEYDQAEQPTGKRLTIQRSHLFNSGGGYLALAVLWLGCLATGLYALIHRPELRRFSCALLAILAGQLALHSVYGEETFLYGLHFLPLLIVGVSFLSVSKLFSQRKILVTILTSVLIVLVAVNNVSRLYSAATTSDLARHDDRLQRLMN